jgi:hypothetical protein
MAYLVTSPLVVAKDQTGFNRHYYHGAVIPWLNDEQREHFLSHGLVEEIADKAAEKIAPEGAVKPAKTAPVEKWVEYGVTQGHDRGELDALAKQSKQDLIELLS